MVNREFEVDHRLSDREANVHYAWDNSIEPVLTIESGDVVRFECPDAQNGKIDLDTTPEEIPDITLDPGHALVGPIAVEGATPGDVLQVDLLEIRHKGWGWTAFRPAEADMGLLPDEFDYPGLHVWDLDDDTGYFVNGIEIPLDPFPGNVGVAPAEDGTHHTVPPRSTGGNMDVKYLTEGSTAYFPVAVDDALFSVGDGHAAQGDGEVCVTAIEAPIFLTARIRVRPDIDVEQPEFTYREPDDPSRTGRPMYATTGISDDLMDATRRAVSHMIEHLHTEQGLSEAEAYLLCSVAVDLKINQVVADPNWTVSAHLPTSIFPE